MEAPIVRAGSIHSPTGKLAEPRAAFSDLVRLADYVLVEADGAKRLPLKAHAEHEPVIPACAGRTVCMVGVDGLGAPPSRRRATVRSDSRSWPAFPSTMRSRPRRWRRCCASRGFMTWF